MANEHILVVEDEQDILELITYNLEKANYKVSGFPSGEDALKALPGLKPDLVILDLMLPGLDGMEVCKTIKGNTKTSDTRVMMLTAKDEEADIVTGLEVGADDYMTKPFSPKVLQARIKALMRRGEARTKVEDGVLEMGDLMIHPGKHEVKIDGTTLNLTNMEFKILHFLASHQGWAYTRSQIVAAIRGENFAVTDRSVDTLVVGLRKKLGQHSHLIETVRSVGYRFKDLSQD
ncbi:MAG: response regulator transcription factor [Acidobacteriota bacterium]|nr:response regulator transcription factor [Acidobacteriota bacterium]